MVNFETKTKLIVSINTNPEVADLHCDNVGGMSKSAAVFACADEASRAIDRAPSSLFAEIETRNESNFSSWRGGSCCRAAVRCGMVVADFKTRGIETDEDGEQIDETPWRWTNKSDVAPEILAQAEAICAAGDAAFEAEKERILAEAQAQED